MIHPLTMPKWGLSMAEGQIGDWLVPEGMEVKPGVELVAIETDKNPQPARSECLPASCAVSSPARMT